MRRLVFYTLYPTMALFLAGCPLLNPFLEGPESNFEGAPVYGTAPLTVLFTDLSEAGIANIEAWQWDFGDGTTSTLRSPSHIYDAPGVYTVSLTVTTSVGTDTALRADYIQAVEEPDADFSATPLNGGAPLTVSFVDTSTPGSSPITAWEWNFGDRSPISTEQNPNHTYTAPGRYTVSLKVTTGVSADKESKAAFIDVVAALEANFASDFSTGVAPLDVKFTDTSTTGSATVLSWAWDFGDGGMSAEQDPAYTYAAPGVYTVSLKVETIGGEDLEVKVGYITVDQGPTAAFTGEPIAGPAPLSVVFTDESAPGTQAINRRVWDFGDGGLLSSLANPVRIYNLPGTYDVSLRVTTTAGSNILLKPAYITVTEPEGTDTPVAKSVLTEDDFLAADLSAIAADVSGDVLAIGVANSPVVLRMDPYGRRRWIVALAHEAGLALNAVHAPGDGTVYVAGTLGNRAWAARLDALGEFMWAYQDAHQSNSVGAGLTSGPDGTVILGVLRADASEGFGLHLITLDEVGSVLASPPVPNFLVERASVALASLGGGKLLALVAEEVGASAVSIIDSGIKVATRYGAWPGLPVAISASGVRSDYYCAVTDGISTDVFKVDEDGIAKALLNVPGTLIAISASEDGASVTWLSRDEESSPWELNRELYSE